MSTNIFSIRLKALRKAAGLTQAELSKALGSSRSQINNLESGTRFTNPEMFLAIADYFNVTTDYLLGRTDDPHNTNLNPKIA